MLVAAQPNLSAEACPAELSLPADPGRFMAPGADALHRIGRGLMLPGQPDLSGGFRAAEAVVPGTS
jgi:hypothetical protein